MDNFDVTKWNRDRYLAEIKVNNPNDIFHVTELGKQAFQDFINLNRIVGKYITDDTIGIFDDTKNKNWWDLLNYSIAVDEAVIDLEKTNKLENYLKSYNDIFGDDKEALSYLESYKKQGWIK
jgi:DNA-binding PadR family transcriptional regulator